MNPELGYFVTFKKLVLFTFLGMLLMDGCGIFPAKMRIDDPRVRPFLGAALEFDRSRHGFTPIPASGGVYLETRPRAGYDAMLHIYGKTSRTISFRKSATGYVWIGEQEIFEGPKVFKTVDGPMNEEIAPTYETTHISGSPLDRINITNTGEDSRLADQPNLSLDTVKPVLMEWGY